MTTIERLDIDRLHREITQSVKAAHGVRSPSESDTQKTIELIQKCWEGFHGMPPMLGEWVKKGDEYVRIAFVRSRINFRDTTFQPAKAGSFYLHEGCGDFAGSLDSPVTMDLKHIGWRLAEFWIFYAGETGARRGVYFTIPTRVFAEEQVAADPASFRDDIEMLLSYIREFESEDYENQIADGQCVTNHPFEIAQRIDSQMQVLFGSDGKLRTDPALHDGRK